MKLNNYDKALRVRVRKYFDLKWKELKGIEEETLIQELP